MAPTGCLPFSPIFALIAPSLFPAIFILYHIYKSIQDDKLSTGTQQRHFWYHIVMICYFCSKDNMFKICEKCNFEFKKEFAQFLTEIHYYKMTTKEQFKEQGITRAKLYSRKYGMWG